MHVETKKPRPKAGPAAAPREAGAPAADPVHRLHHALGNAEVARMIQRAPAPGAPGALQRLTTLPPAPGAEPGAFDLLLERLRSASLADVAGVAARAAVGTAFPFLGPALAQLEPERVIAALRGLDVQQLRDLLSEARVRQTVVGALKAVVDRVWPVGAGFSVSAGIGATFGYPIYLGADAIFVVTRGPGDTVRFLRRGELREALDVGAGWGAYVGTGARRKRSQPGDASEYGFGGAAGVQAEAGFKQIAHQEYEFPLYDGPALLGLLMAVTTADLGAGPELATRVLESMTHSSIDPERYNTRSRIDLAVYGQAVAEASFGARLGTTEEGGKEAVTTRGRKGWTSRSEAPDFGKSPTFTDTAKEWWAEGRDLFGKKDEGAKTPTPSPGAQAPAAAGGPAAKGGGASRWHHLGKIMSLINVELRGALSKQTAFGIDMRQTEHDIDPRTGLREPRTVEVDVFIERSSLSTLELSGLGLGGVLPALGTESGGGIKLTFLAKAKKEDEAKVGLLRYSVFHKTGELEYYAGAGSETELRMGAAPIRKVLDSRGKELPTFEEFLASIEELRFRRRLMVGGPFLARKYERALRRMRGVRTLMNRRTRGGAPIVEGYVTVGLRILGADVRAILTQIHRSLDERYRKGNGWTTMVADFMRFVTGGDLTPFLARHAETIARAVQVVELSHQEAAGAGIAGSIHAAEGAKVRLHGHLSGRLIRGGEHAASEKAPAALPDVLEEAWDAAGQYLPDSLHPDEILDILLMR